MKLLRRPVSASDWIPDTILHHQYGISVAESQTLLLAERLSAAIDERGETSAARRLIKSTVSRTTAPDGLTVH